MVASKKPHLRVWFFCFKGSGGLPNFVHVVGAGSRPDGHASTQSFLVMALRKTLCWQSRALKSQAT